MKVVFFSFLILSFFGGLVHYKQEKYVYEITWFKLLNLICHPVTRLFTHTQVSVSRAEWVKTMVIR